MNIHEYQAKEILRAYQIPVPKGVVVNKPEDAANFAWKIEGELAVVKAQIHAGGRGKAGGVKIAKSITEVQAFAKELLGKNLVTRQTGPAGQPIKTILIEEGCSIDKEYYIGLTLDRQRSRIALLASAEGGTDIELIAANRPERIFKEVIDPLLGLSVFQARRLCFKLNLPIDLINDFVQIMLNLYRCFSEKDCTLAEINPLVLSQDHRLMALDAKLKFDENSLYRNKDIIKYRDLAEEDEKERAAFAHGLSYICLDGNIGCMVNGAGLAMATMDMIKAYGGEPANFLDVGGGASEEKVTNAFKIILSDPRVKGIFVNIFGGIMKCDVIARAVIKAVQQVKLNIPLVVRLEGTNVIVGKEILNNSGLNIWTAASIDEGAKKIVELTQ